MHITKICPFPFSLMIASLLWSAISYADDHFHDETQVFQSTLLENAWLVDKHGQGTYESKLEYWRGTDEHKLGIEAHLSKTESEPNQADIALMYRYKIADYWDIQSGLRYRNDQTLPKQNEQMDVMFGFNGLAPYFLHTKAFVYVGKDQQVSFRFDTERAFWLTQKLNILPYLNSVTVLSDNSRDAKKSGLSDFRIGLKTQYEWTKKIIPYIDFAYNYDKGQQASATESGWIYGAGLKLDF